MIFYRKSSYGMETGTMLFLQVNLRCAVCQNEPQLIFSPVPFQYGQCRLQGTLHLFV
jgi:hypothetical protein